MVERLESRKHIFFDLDRTLWDFDRNSIETLSEIFEKYQLFDFGIERKNEFISVYQEINENLWLQFRDEKISREDLRNTRFKLALKAFGISNQLLEEEINFYYMDVCPKKANLHEGALQTLEHLSQKYQLHIITNGFKDVQFTKLKSCKIIHYFKEVITSEDAGVKKPHSSIFEYALNKANTTAFNSIMIGDDIDVDLLPAKKLGFETIHFSPNATKTNSSKIVTIKNQLDLLGLL